MKVWNPVLNIPEGKSGNFEIEHAILLAGSILPTSSMRTTLFGGHKKKDILFEEETLWHKLLEDGGVWMTDLPIEQAQCDSHLESFCGRVLVGGLGLGYAATMLCQREEVSEVVVVEISQDVINLVAPHIQHPKLTVIHMDIFEYLEKGEKFDFAFYDIWQSDGEGTFLHTVVPLRGLSQGLIDDQKIVCWNEDIMRGQLMFSLISRINLSSSESEVINPLGLRIDDFCEYTEGKGCQYINWSVRFFRAIRDDYLIGTETEAAEEFVKLYGCLGWTKKWED